MRRKQKRGSGVPGLVRRGTRAYFARVIPAKLGGDRLYCALEAVWGSEEAIERAMAVNTLWGRGDWPVVRRWAAGEVHISELVRAVREGDYGRLKRVNVAGLLLGAAAESHVRRIDATSARSTYNTHKSVCDALVQHFGAEYAMEQLTTPEAEAFLHKPRENGETWAPRTQLLYRMIAGAFWNYAIERETEEASKRGLESTLRANPWRKAKIREARRKRPQVLTEAELYALINHAAVVNTPRQALLAIAGYAGLRQQEITKLRLDLDIFLDADRPFLRIQSREGEHTWDTKTERSERDVRIPAILVEIIRSHIASGFAGVRYLFRIPGKDQPIHHSTAERWTEDAYTAAGILYGRDEGEGLTLHSLRHTHATILLSKGVSIAAVAARLGDTQKVVLETYSHVLPDDEERALQILELTGRGLLTTTRAPLSFDGASPGTGVFETTSKVHLDTSSEDVSLECATSVTNSGDASLRSSTPRNSSQKGYKSTSVDRPKTAAKRPYSAPKLRRLTSPPVGVVFPNTHKRTTKGEL